MFIRIIQAVTDAGLWKGEQRNGISFLAKCSILCFLGVYILQLIALILALENLEKMFECFSVITFCGMGILKLFSLQFRRETWLKLLEQISEFEENSFQNVSSAVEYNSEDEDQPNDPFKGEKNHVEKFKTTFTLLRRTYQFTAVIYILSPFVEYGFRSFLGDKPSQFPHILPSWSPLDDVHFLWYIAMIVLETIAAEYCVFVHIAYDLTVIGIMIFICGQCTILFDQSTRIGGRGRKCRLSRRRDERALFRIIVCHKTHILLVKSISILNSLIKDIIGVYFILSTLTLCSVALQLKSDNLSVMKIMSLLQFTCATLTQLFLFCTYGNEVFITSSINMGEGPYASAVWCLSPKIRNDIQLLSIGMSKARQLHAGPFNVVNLSSFITIVRAAYSCYAVVRNK